MALVSKILEATLTAGSTTVTFTDSDIPNSLIRVFSSNSDIIPESRTLSGNTLTVTYAPQSNNIDVAVEIVKQGLDIVDNVLSEDTDKALSAKQGYMLSAAIGDVSDGLSTLSETVNNLDIPDNITDLDDVTVTDIQSGQVLAWDGTKFVNVDQSASSSVVYSTDEQLIGKWINNENLYQKTINFGNLPNATSKNVAHGISNLDRIISAEGFAKSSANQTPIPFVNNTTVGSQVVLIVDNTNVTLRTSDDRSVYTGYITLQYTKTS